MRRDGQQPHPVTTPGLLLAASHCSPCHIGKPGPGSGIPLYVRKKLGTGVVVVGYAPVLGNQTKSSVIPDP